VKRREQQNLVDVKKRFLRFLLFLLKKLGF